MRTNPTLRTPASYAEKMRKLLGKPVTPTIGTMTDAFKKGHDQVVAGMPSLAPKHKPEAVPPSNFTKKAKAKGAIDLGEKEPNYFDPQYRFEERVGYLMKSRMLSRAEAEEIVKRVIRTKEQ